MPCDGAITFRDIAGKLTVLRITCDKCGRSGQYRVDRPILRYGIAASKRQNGARRGYSYEQGNVRGAVFDDVQRCCA